MCGVSQLPQTARLILGSRCSNSNYFYGCLYHPHLAFIPFFERHTALDVFDDIEKLLDAIFHEWRDKMLFVSSDGENTMPGRHYGVLTRLEQTAKRRILRNFGVYLIKSTLS